MLPPKEGGMKSKNDEKKRRGARERKGEHGRVGKGKEMVTCTRKV